MKTRVSFAAVLGLMMVLVAAGQEGMQQQPKAAQPTEARPRVYTIAVTVQSKDPRVKAIIPSLNNEVADEVERQSKNARAMIVIGTKGEAAEQARRRNADYLLTIEFSPQPTAAIGYGAPPPRNPEIYGSDRANAQGRMFIAWTVDPLNDNRVRLHDSRYVEPAEYPLAGTRPTTGAVVGWDWVSSIASRAVRDAAMTALGKLKMKKGLGLEIDIKGSHGHESKQP